MLSSLLTWIMQHPAELATVAAGGCGLYLMLPRGPSSDAPLVRVGGAFLVALALILGASQTIQPLTSGLRGAGFGVLAGVSVTAAVATITSRNPVFSALWFALVLLSNSGLYLMMGAEFLSAATVIIYAGAIIVTFLFVIMLAQPRGTAPSDRNAREAAMSAAAGAILAATLVAALHGVVQTEREPDARAAGRLPSQELVSAAVEQVSATRPLAAGGADPHVKSLGRNLFRDHYVSILLIGALLLVVACGAFLIVQEEPAGKRAAGAA